MSQTFLIADSGGTKTDWCFINEKGDHIFFETEGYHPNHWNSEFVNRLTSYWSKHFVPKSTSVTIFCAGCHKKDKAQGLKLIFNQIGFKKCKVSSDLEGAAIALYGKSPGNIAIQGTGSVYFRWTGDEVYDIRGGKGHELGDEGSGFYFGKLVYQDFISKNLTTEQLEAFKSQVDLESITYRQQNGEQKLALAEIAACLKDKPKLFQNYHYQNISAFINDVLDTSQENELAIVGGYFYANEDLLLPVYTENNVKVTRYIKKPIHHLVDNLSVFTD